MLTGALVLILMLAFLAGFALESYFLRRAYRTYRTCREFLRKYCLVEVGIDATILIVLWALSVTPIFFLAVMAGKYTYKLFYFIWTLKTRVLNG